jgi:hypothetical protein
MIARQVLNHLSHVPSPVLLLVFQMGVSNLPQLAFNQDPLTSAC